MKFNKILSLSAVLASLALVGCGDSLLENLNENTEVSDQDESGLTVINNREDLGGYLLTAEQALFATPEYTNQNNPHKYQAKFNLYLDNFGGYMASTQNFDGNLNTTYSYYSSYAESTKSFFFEVSRSTLPVIRSAAKLGVPEVGAVASILYSYAALELADVYGPFPWYDYKNEKQDPPLTYVSLKEIYTNLFKDLEDAAAILDGFKNKDYLYRDSVNAIIGKYDKIFVKNMVVLNPDDNSAINNVANSSFQDDEKSADELGVSVTRPDGTARYFGIKLIENWRRFANTIRLRMALRVSNVDEELAKEKASSAYNSGLLTVPVAFNESALSQHPLYPISANWNDTRLNASFENILKRLNCPLLEVLFDKNNSKILKPVAEGAPVDSIGTDSLIIGIRTGVPLTKRDDTNKYLSFSRVSERFKSEPITIFRTSEVYFLLAEACVRWPGLLEATEGAQLDDFSLYIGGIENMLAVYGIIDGAYAFNTEVKDIDYYDYTYSKDSRLYEEKGQVTLPVMYQQGADQKTRIEQIITQKWIGNFPYGLEAWNDLRRTGFPRIFVQKYDVGDGTIAPGQIIRRLPWDESNAALKFDIESGKSMLQQDNPDNYSGNDEVTRLWWDVTDKYGDNDRF